jgi:hypothetical protein
MTDAPAEPNTLRSIGVVAGGIILGIVVTLLTDIVLHAVHVFPPWGQPPPDGPLALATAYRVVYSTVASYVIARFAPNRPMMHAMIAGFLGFAVSIAGAVATWNNTAVFGPHWYPIALVVTALPSAWLGAKIHLLRH